MISVLDYGMPKFSTYATPLSVATESGNSHNVHELVHHHTCKILQVYERRITLQHGWVHGKY